MIVDTSALLAFFSSDESAHQTVSALFAEADPPFVVPEFVVAELGYLVMRRYGVAAELTVLRELASGAWTLVGLAAEGLQQAIGVVERYRDHEIGISDASLLVLAERYRTRTVATLDRRHFEVVRPIQGGRFVIVP